MYSENEMFIYFPKRQGYEINSKGNNEIPQSTEKYGKGL